MSNKSQAEEDDERLLASIHEAITVQPMPAIVVTDPRNHIHDTDSLIRRCREKAIFPPLQIDVLNKAIALADEHPLTIAERELLLSHLEIKRSTLNNRVKPLINVGVIRMHRIKTKRPGPTPRVFILDLSCLADLVTRAVEGESPGDWVYPNMVDEEAISAIADRGLPVVFDKPVKDNQLVMLALPTLLPGEMDTKHSYVEKSVRYGNQHMYITICGPTGLCMAQVPDIRVLAAVISICSDRSHHQWVEPKNPWFMRVDEIADFIKRCASDSETLRQDACLKSWIVDALFRWQGTKFEIRYAKPRTNRYYGHRVVADHSFFLIDAITVVSAIGTDGVKLEDMCLYLNERLVELVNKSRPPSSPLSSQFDNSRDD